MSSYLAWNQDYAELKRKLSLIYNILLDVCGVKSGLYRGKQCTLQASLWECLLLRQEGATDCKVTPGGGKLITQNAFWASSVVFCLDRIPCVEKRKTAEAMRLDWSISKTFPTQPQKILLEKLIQKDLDKSTVMVNELKGHGERVQWPTRLTGCT